MTGTPGILMTIDHTKRFENLASLLHLHTFIPTDSYGILLIVSFSFLRAIVVLYNI